MSPYDPSAKALFLRASAYRANGDVGESIADFKRLQALPEGALDEATHKSIASQMRLLQRDRTALRAKEQEKFGNMFAREELKRGLYNDKPDAPPPEPKLPVVIVGRAWRLLLGAGAAIRTVLCCGRRRKPAAGASGAGAGSASESKKR